MTFLFGHVHFLASRAVDFDPGCSDIFTHANWQHILPFAEDSRADSESSFQKLLLHHAESFGCEYESGMDETIQINSFMIVFHVSGIKTKIPFIFEFLLGWGILT